MFIDFFSNETPYNKSVISISVLDSLADKGFDNEKLSNITDVKINILKSNFLLQVYLSIIKIGRRNRKHMIPVRPYEFSKKITKAIIINHKK